MSKVKKSTHRGEDGKIRNTVKTDFDNGVRTSVTRRGSNDGFFGGKIESTSRNKK